MISTSKWWALITWLFPIIVYPIVGGLLAYNAANFLEKSSISTSEWFSFAQNIIFWICGVFVTQIILDVAIGATLFNHWKKRGFVIQVIALVFSLLTIILQLIALFTVYKYVKLWNGYADYNLYDEIVDNAMFLAILIPSSTFFGFVAWILQVVSSGMLQTTKKIREKQNQAQQQIQQQQGYMMPNYPQFNNQPAWGNQQQMQMAPAPQFQQQPNFSNNQGPMQNNVQRPSNMPPQQQQQQNNNSTSNDDKFEQELERVNKLLLKKKISESEYKKQVEEIEKLYG